MDFRLIEKIEELLKNKGYENNYDYFILAGASLGVKQNLYPEWVKTFKDHLDLSLSLHHIHEVIFVDHMDCGFYKKMFPEMKPSEEKGKHE